MRTLFLGRHAKSSWNNALLADQDRPLNERGLRDAPRMGKRLAARNIRPDLIISSPALRAYDTAVKIADEIDYPVSDIQVTKEIYLEGKTGILNAISLLDSNIDSVMLIGHNPGITITTNYLTQADLGNIPTCGIAEIQFDFELWSEIDSSTGKMVLFDYPKRIKD